jgi:hypothetical protein
MIIRCLYHLIVKKSNFVLRTFNIEELYQDIKYDL